MMKSELRMKSKIREKRIENKSLWVNLNIETLIIEGF